MKKIGIIWILLIILITTSCDRIVIQPSRVGLLNRNTKKESEQSKEYAEEIIRCINEEDAEGIKALFAPAALEKMDTVDEDIQKLFDFVSGDIIYYNPHATPGSTGHYDHGVNTLLCNQRWTLETEEGMYNLFILWYRMNDPEPEEVGLQQIAVSDISMERGVPTGDVDSEEINSGVFVQQSLDLTTEDGQRSEELAMEVVELIENEDAEGIKDLFAENAFEERERLYKELYKDEENYVYEYDVDEQLEEIFKYYEGEFISLEHNVRDLSLKDEAGVTRVRDNWVVKTTEREYLLYIAECREDKNNPENEGVYVIGVTDKDPIGSSLTSWETSKYHDKYDFPGVYAGTGLDGWDEERTYLEDKIVRDKKYYDEEKIKVE